MSPPLEHDYIASLVASSSSSSSPSKSAFNHLLKETELRLGLPGSNSPERTTTTTTNPQLGGSGFTLFGKDGFVSGGANKRGFAQNHVLEKKIQVVAPASDNSDSGNAPAAKAQVVGWPPIRSFRKNSMATSSMKNDDEAGCLYVKVSMDGAPCLRTVDLNVYTNYSELSSALEKKFSCFTIGQCGSHRLPGRDGISESHLIDLLHGSEFVITYEDKDGDWMLVGDVPWQMFASSCRRMRIMKGSEAIGLAPRAMEKSKHRNLQETLVRSTTTTTMLGFTRQLRQ